MPAQVYAERTLRIERALYAVEFLDVGNERRRVLTLGNPRLPVLEEGSAETLSGTKRIPNASPWIHAPPARPALYSGATEGSPVLRRLFLPILGCLYRQRHLALFRHPRNLPFRPVKFLRTDAPRHHRLPLGCSGLSSGQPWIVLLYAPIPCASSRFRSSAHALRQHP